MHLNFHADASNIDPPQALDYLLWSEPDPSSPSPNARGYLTIATQAAEYFMHHFQNRSADGRVVVWPAQVLETYWCTWNASLQVFENCCANDSPTVSGMITLIAKLISLPEALTTPSQRESWATFRNNLMPKLPTKAGPGGAGPESDVIAVAEVVSNGTHNGEGPELYAIHPHRVFTKGKAVATGMDISLGQRTVENSIFAKSHTAGWSYGINAFALIGDSASASQQLLGRVNTPPALGYRFPGFAPHEQDYEPSADHFANMNRALQEMLIQSGDDGFASTTIVSVLFFLVVMFGDDVVVVNVVVFCIFCLFVCLGGCQARYETLYECRNFDKIYR